MGTECQKDYCEEDKQLLDEAEEAARREQEQGLCEQAVAEFAKAMPAIEKVNEEATKRSEEMWKEIDAQFPEVEDVLDEKIDKSISSFKPDDPWTPDEFEKAGFGPITRQPPRPDCIFGDIKEVETGEVIIKGGQKTLGRAFVANGITEINEPRGKQESEKREAQITGRLEALKGGATPEEKAILKELGIAKDSEQREREQIKQGIGLHEDGHHLMANPQVFTFATTQKWAEIYQRCKESGQFVSPRAANDLREFVAENYRVFFTDPARVESEHPQALREVEKIVSYLTLLELMEQPKKEK